MCYHPSHFVFFFFNDTATTEIYTLSLHDALPILTAKAKMAPKPSNFAKIVLDGTVSAISPAVLTVSVTDRKSTRLNSSHQIISYAVFCLKKKKNNQRHNSPTHKPQYHSIPSHIPP